MNAAAEAGGGGAPPPGQYPPPPAGYGPPAQPSYGVPRPTNGVGVAGGVVGIVAAALLWIPWVGIILGVVAVALSGVGLQRANQMGGTSKGMAITGIVCGLIAVILNLIFLIAIYSTFHSVTVTSP